MEAHQYRIRVEASQNEIAPDIDVSIGASYVRPTSYSDAKVIIEKYEWLGRMSATRYHYGLYYDPFWNEPCGGVVCFGGTNCTGGSYLHTPWGLESHEVGILARGACLWWTPEHAPSHLVGRALRQLKHDSAFKIVLAYSDPRAGEIGTIYQATNWIYYGLSSTSYRYISPDGENSFSDAAIIVEAQKRGLRWKDVNREYLDNGWTKEKQARKFRYAYLLDKKDKRLRRLFEEKSKPYPKREVEFA